MSRALPYNNPSRKIFLVCKYKNIAARLSAFEHEVLLYQTREASDRENFLRDCPIESPRTDLFGSDAITSISSALRYWAEHGSFYVCDSCNSIVAIKMPHNFLNRPKPSRRTKCHCLNKRYHVPRFHEIPKQLLNLSRQSIIALRPFELDCGAYQRQRHGYRLKTGMTQLYVSEKSVLDKIRELPDPTDRQECRVAYEYLMSSPSSSYSHFIQLRNDLIEGKTDLNCFDFSVTVGIECALWPNLYPFTTWCESGLSGKNNRLSVKKSFCAKLFSEIVDYALHFDLLQWQYDRALYKVVSGAINTARFSHCSPARALDAKPFSPTYWQWQHRYLLDAVQQFGLPDAFITISPYEWSFPFPDWLSSIRKCTGMGPTQLPMYETFHITHVLEQLVRGYLCGSTNQKWSQHIFSYNNSTIQKNVKTFFYRFEFQERGTVHLHMLVWLRDIAKARHEFIRADIPSSHTELAYWVNKLQPSDKPAYCLNLQSEESFFRLENGKNVQHLKYPAIEFALHLRAYIATVLPALKCRMDYQTTDGIGMLLRYVTSYVTKSHDSTTIDSMYSYKLEGRQAAVRYLMRNTPAEPEMCFFLFSKKVAWAGSRTKRFSPPTSHDVNNDKTVLKYWKRDKNFESLSMIEWLRQFDTSKQTPKLYKQGSTLVGTKVLSIFNSEYFFQYVLLHLPHRDFATLCHPNHDQLPEQLKWYAAAAYHFSALWKDEANLRTFLTSQGHREFYIDTIISYISSLHDMFQLFQMGLINIHQMSSDVNTNEPGFALDNYQLAVARHIEKAVELRQRYHHIDGSFTSEENSSDGDTDSDSDMEDDTENEAQMHTDIIISLSNFY